MDDNAARLLEQRIAAAGKAERDLAIVQPRLDSLREGYFKAWKAAKAEDMAGRERLWLAYQTVEAVERDFRTAMGDAQVAQAQLDSLKGQ